MRFSGFGYDEGGRAVFKPGPRALARSATTQALVRGTSELGPESKLLHAELTSVRTIHPLAHLQPV